MLGRLVGAISHELATPLGTIVIGTHDLVALTRDGNEEASELARAIAGEARRASDIIGLFKGHLRPDLRAETLDLAALVRDIAAEELERLDFRGTSVIDARVPVQVNALRVGVGQVLRNLLTNAVHATREAHAWSHQGRIEVIVAAKGASAEIQVVDNGPGFSPDIAERLGEPFQTTRAHSGGLGLGLYVSSMLAKQMRASLRVEDAEGGGARVTLTLDRGAAGGSSA
jgi:signal transduction histidine kinase